MKIQANNPLVSTNFSDKFKQVKSLQNKNGVPDVSFMDDSSESLQKVEIGNRLPQIDNQINAVQERISLNQTVQSVLPQIKEAIEKDPEAARDILKSTEFNSENVFKQLGIDVKDISTPEDVASLEKTISGNISKELGILSKLDVMKENVIASSVSIDGFNNAKQMLGKLGGFGGFVSSINSNLNSEAASSLLDPEF
ncbi:hypothetical protein KAJ27_14715 [bacterium]|nr:hypothetical protein [bacterium]